MVLGELQYWSSLTRGCASRSFFVRFLYASKALMMISWKLEAWLEDEEAVGWV
jgi:hypothetical protein